MSCRSDMDMARDNPVWLTGYKNVFSCVNPGCASHGRGQQIQALVYEMGRRGTGYAWTHGTKVESYETEIVCPECHTTNYKRPDRNAASANRTLPASARTPRNTPVNMLAYFLTSLDPILVGPQAAQAAAPAPAPAPAPTPAPAQAQAPVRTPYSPANENLRDLERVLSSRLFDEGVPEGGEEVVISYDSGVEYTDSGMRALIYKIKPGKLTPAPSPTSSATKKP